MLNVMFRVAQQVFGCGASGENMVTGPIEEEGEEEVEKQKEEEEEEE
jgi:hypothetical protein